MRFMFIVKSAHAGPPTPELLEAMNKLADRRDQSRPHARQWRANAARHRRAGAHQGRAAQRRRRPVRGSERGRRRLRALRAAGQGRGLGVCDGGSCNSIRTSSRAGRGLANFAGSLALEPMVRRALLGGHDGRRTHRAILAVWRVEQPRLITSLARMLRDVPLAEDLTQEALLAALERWPATGVPERPGAWLMATAKRRALDHLRREADAQTARTRADRPGHGGGGNRPCPIGTPHWTTTYAMRPASSSSSPPVARVCRARPARGPGAPNDLWPDDRRDRQGIFCCRKLRSPSMRRARQTNPFRIGPKSMRPHAARELSERLFSSVLEVVYLIFQRRLHGRARRGLAASPSSAARPFA